MCPTARPAALSPVHAALVAALALATPVALDADERDHGHLHIEEEIIVYGRAQRHIGTTATASEGVVGYADYHLSPLLRVGELVEAVPGMVATQHSGTGKANQYFLRGFNLDHGTDFSAHLDDVPINMRTHGHGQGYLDLNFIIPEMVETAEYRKGVYHAEKGDFSSAGSVDFAYRTELPEPLVQVALGDHGYARGMSAGSAPLSNGVLTGAVAATRYEGPWRLDENLEQYKFHVGYRHGFGPVEVRAALHGYDSQWNATDQIPRRAVRADLLDRTGFVDPDLGGQTRRIAGTAQADAGSWRIGAYWLDYDFTLFSNFTYLLDDPARGDEFEQRDDRTVRGLWLHGDTSTWIADLPVSIRWGVDARFDDIDEVGLYDTAARVRTDVSRRDRVDEASVGAYGEIELRLGERLRSVLGLRADYYDWDVSALRADDDTAGDDRLASPKISLAYEVTDGLEAYLSWGRGFHSNDVRVLHGRGDRAAASAGAPDVLAASEGAEIGLRFEPDPSFNATLIGFWLELDSELVYVGDAGVTEPSDASARKGLELTTFWQARDWLTLNAAYTVSDAELDGGEEVPGAVERTFHAGANLLLGGGVHASLNVRYLGDAPLVEDGSVRSDASWLMHAGVAWHYRRAEFALDLFNVLDSPDDDIAYYYASRLPGEPADGVLDTHFHPLEPRTMRARFVLHF